MNSQTLNQSKFLSEQINNEEQPTEEEVIEKAEELGISDLGLAREALTKELDPQWKPYLNRRGEVYYINLEEKKAYIDHPVDMEIRITDALRHKKRIPIFRQFAIEEVSKSPRLIQQEFNRYQREKGLNVVYEQSDEESLRRDTVQSAEQHLAYSQLMDLDKGELQLFRIETERQMRADLATYRAEKEEEYSRQVNQSKQAIQGAKRSRLAQISIQNQQEIQAKNDIIYKKSVQATKEELLAKKYRLQDLHAKEIQLAYKLSSSREAKEQQIKHFYRTKRYQNKQKMMQKTQLEVINSANYQTRKEIEQAVEDYQTQTRQIISSKLNLRDKIFQNLDKLTNDPAKSKDAKKRYPIFNTELFGSSNPDSANNSLSLLTDKLKLDDPVHSKYLVPSASQVPRPAPSLLLRFSLRIL